jgi:hypothetical protein
MSSEIQSRLATMLSQLQVLNGRLHVLDERKRGVGPAIGKEVLGEVGGALAEEIFGSSGAGDLGYSLTKKWAAQKQKQENETEQTRIAYELKQVLEQGIALLSEVSIDSPFLKPPGNSRLIVRRLKRIASMVRLETRLLRAIQFLQNLQTEKLVHNKDIREEVLARPRDQEAYGLMKELESVLRKLIGDLLSGVSATWWKDRYQGTSEIEPKRESLGTSRCGPGWLGPTSTLFITLTFQTT